MEETRKTEVTISMVRVNILVMVTFIAMLACVIFAHVLIFGNAELTVTLPGFLLFLAAMLIFVVVHEAPFNRFPLYWRRTEAGFGLGF